MQTERVIHEAKALQNLKTQTKRTKTKQTKVLTRRSLPLILHILIGIRHYQNRIQIQSSPL